MSGATTYILAVKDLTSGNKFMDDVNIGNTTSYTIPSYRIIAGLSYKIALGAKNGYEEALVVSHVE